MNRNDYIHFPGHWTKLCQRWQNFCRREEFQSTSSTRFLLHSVNGKYNIIVAIQQMVTLFVVLEFLFLVALASFLWPWPFPFWHPDTAFFIGIPFSCPRVVLCPWNPLFPGWLSSSVARIHPFFFQESHPRLDAICLIARSNFVGECFSI